MDHGCSGCSWLSSTHRYLFVHVRLHSPTSLTGCPALATFLRDVTWTQWRRILCSEGSHYSRQLSQLIPMTDFTLDSSPSWKSSTHGSFFHPLPLDSFRELDDSSVLAPCALPQIFCCSDSARALCPQAGAFDSSTRDQICGLDALRRHAVRRVVPFLVACDLAWVP